MERSDDRLSTRDIASPGTTEDARFERDDAVDEPATTAAPTRDTMADPTLGTGGSTRGSAGAEPDATATAGPIAADEPATTREPLTTTEPTDRSAPAAATPAKTTTPAGDAGPLLADGEGFQSRWEEIQVRFVDEPRRAVEDADALVATVMQKLAESFAQERERLEAQWGRGEDISTEDLRVALQRYRSFFQRLLAT
jgi:hypothetical protein